MYKNKKVKIKDGIKQLKKEFKLILNGSYNTDPSKSKGARLECARFDIKFILEWMQTFNFKNWN